VEGRFEELVLLARTNPNAFREVTRQECLDAARAHAHRRFREIREGHEARDAAVNVVHRLADAADELMTGVLRFAHVTAGVQPTRFCLCALGSYGRRELSPHSDLDVSLVYDGRIDAPLEALNEYLIPFVWDMGFQVGYSMRSLRETCDLALQDPRHFTAILQVRLINGDHMTFARLKLFLRELHASPTVRRFIQELVRGRYETAEGHQDVFTPQPHVKEGQGGLRDFQVGMWLFAAMYDVRTLDDITAHGFMTEGEHLELLEALDFAWRVRNEMHFHAGKTHDRLDFAMQEHLARAFGFGSVDTPHITAFMEDYYRAAQRLHAFLRRASRTWDAHLRGAVPLHDRHEIEGVPIRAGEIEAGVDDPDWFSRQPARLMEVYWRCAQLGVSLSHYTERAIARNLHLINEAFRESEPVRRLFQAICGDPMQAGRVLRMMAQSGLLQRYLPEFRAVENVIRYEDFHHYPVNEHTLRAIEALCLLPERDDPVHRCLYTVLRNLPDPDLLVMAILFHDLGKAVGEVHMAESERLTCAICARIGMPTEDAERLAFLVRHHDLMTMISQYRDFEDDDTVHELAATVQTEQRLQALFLISYADLSAVGPNVWNDWKGSLLMGLFLRTEQALAGDAAAEGVAYWESGKALDFAARTGGGEAPIAYLRAMGPRYFAGFTPVEMAGHLALLDEARAQGLAVAHNTHDHTGMTELVVCTGDHPGLFGMIAGAFASLLVDVNAARLFTHPDGFAVDAFMVCDARNRRPLTTRQCQEIASILKAVLLDGAAVQAFVDRARKRIFALLQPHLAVPTRVTFDNAASRSHTVIEVETGDRTGLLYDIATAMADHSLDIFTARIVTDARRVRDSFYVTQAGAKIQEPAAQSAVRHAIHAAIHPSVPAPAQEAGP